MMTRRTIDALISRYTAGYLGLALASVPFGRLALALSWRMVAVIAVSLSIMALRESWLSTRRLLERRRASDLWLESSRGGLVPREHAWRAAELVSPRERRVLARGLRNAVHGAKARSPITAALVAPRRVLPHERAIEGIASRLDDISKPVTPQVVLAIRHLLTEPGSPLFFGHDGLGDTLSRIRAELRAAEDPRDDDRSRRAA